MSTRVFRTGSGFLIVTNNKSEILAISKNKQELLQIGHFSKKETLSVKLRCPINLLLADPNKTSIKPSKSQKHPHALSIIYLIKQNKNVFWKIGKYCNNTVFHWSNETMWEEQLSPQKKVLLFRMQYRNQVNQAEPKCLHL